MREAAWGGGLFLIAERPGVRGMGSRSTCPYDTAAPLKRKSALSDYPRPICRASLTRCHRVKLARRFISERLGSRARHTSGRLGAADCGEYRQAAGAVAQVNIAHTTRSNQKALGASLDLNKLRLSSRHTAK